ncbi:type 1 glutamine amidotransferase [Cellulomonas sp. JZ18]|uniref:type 1 glutamine amidotransferase n=1 Tax=Cellulomonas sp. JZ18 TaxID=2654191 RepID=UPI00351ACF9D
MRWRPEAEQDALLSALALAAGRGRTTPQPSMHADAVVDLPRGAVWLASSSTYPFQAFRIGSAWGVQFHPEASRGTMAAWAEAHDDVDTAALLAQLDARADEVEAAGRALAEGFVGVVRARAAVRVPV